MSIELRTKRHSTRSSRAAALTLATLLASPALALRPHEAAHPDYDASGGIRMVQALDARWTTEQQAEISRMAKSVMTLGIGDLNAQTGTPRAVYGTKPLSGPRAGAPDDVARLFLDEHRGLWKLSAEQVQELRLDTTYTDRHNGVSHVYYTQTKEGLPVWTAVLGVHVGARGEVLGVAGDVYPDVTGDVVFALTPERAAKAAGTAIGVALDLLRLRNEGTTAILDRGPLRSEVRVDRWLYTMPGQVGRPAYRMFLDKNGLEWYEVLVDGQTGELLHRRNLYQFATGVVTPSAPAQANPPAPRGLLFVEHPLATVRGTGDLARRYPLTSDPTGRVHGFANAPLFGADVTPTTPNGPDPAHATIAQVLLPLPDASNPLRSNALPLSTSPQSPQGWFTPITGTYYTVGNNVDAKDDHVADDEATIGFRASGGTTGDFSGPGFVYHNFHGQNGPYASIEDRLAGAAPDLNPVVLDLFYFNNWYHDLLYHLGFTEAAGNFQTNNFGRGGFGADHVFADAQDGSGTNNANFGTPPDGANPRMQMFLFDAPERDGDLDLDIVVHEFTHGLSNRLVGGPSNGNCLGTPLVGESGGMGEGWGDWYAGVIADEPTVAEYSVNTTTAGIRRFSMNEGPADFTYSFLCSGPPSNPSLIPCEVHDVGEFWSIVLWEMREAMINRVHNRAFPGGPTFPTFTATLTPDGNIKNAQGRTHDGSGNPAQTDFATIEAATFASMFRVTDGMKLAPCNPTVVDMRDAILAADRALGGGYQDVIWRAFANRGVGLGAASTGGGAPAGATVESFDVPATVAACEAAGGPLASPQFTLSVSANNQLTVNIVPNGATEYAIDRSTAGAGSEIDPAPFVEIARTTSTTFVDTGLNGGVTYWYRVRALRNDDCVSGSLVAAAVPTGGPLPCSTPPTFAGLTRVIDRGDCDHLRLEWSPGTSNCVAGPNVRYNVYRGTQPFFTPSAANRIATGVVGLSYEDAPEPTDVLHYYVVRAEDSTTGGGGPNNGGNQEGNVVRRIGLVTSGELVGQGFVDDVESGPDDETSQHFTSSGRSVPLINERGGWFRDDAPAPVVARSAPTVWHTFNPDNQTFSLSDTTLYELRSDIMTITPDSILEFHHAFATENRFDGGVIEYALVIDEATGTLGTFADLGFLVYEGGYNGVIDATTEDLLNTNPLFGRAAWTGGEIRPMQRVRAYLGGLVPTGETEAHIAIRFLFGNDIANAADPSPTGNFLPGWYIDDVALVESCCPSSAAPTNLQAEAGSGGIELDWTAPAGTIAEYRIYREVGGDVTPVVFDELLAVVSGGTTSYNDASVTGGLTYHYVVRAVPASGCPSAESNVAAAQAVNPCTASPTFQGLERVATSPNGTCTIELSWSPGFSNCTGASVRYNVYRSTSASFVPSPSNAIALGLEALSWVDQSALASSSTYWYVVRAEDTTTGGDGPANGGNEDDNLVRRSGSPDGLLVPGANFSDDLEPAANPGYETFSTRTVGGWQVLTDPTAHSPTRSWTALDDQPGVPELTSKDDRLILPPLSLSATSTLSFWHNWDFARFPLGSPATAYQSGGVLEISPDGEAWIDLGPYITTGGYNGALDPEAQNALAGRTAWVGSSDGNLVGGRLDAMHQVTVDLGSAIEDELGASQAHDARIRFRLGGTFQALIGGIQGTGWGVDDLNVTGVLQASSCSTNSGLVPATLTVDRIDSTTIEVAWQPSCSPGATNYAIYEGTIGDWYSHTLVDCSDDGANLHETVTTAAGSTYYLVVPRNGVDEGSYGTSSNGVERPRGEATCEVIQVIATCP